MDSTPSEPVRKAVAEQAAKQLKGKDVQPVRSVRSARLPDGRSVHRFVTYDARDPNGPRHIAVLGDDGKAVDPTILPRDVARTIGAEVTREITPRSLGLATLAASASIDPRSNDLVLELGDVEEEVVTVTIPPNAGVSKADIYLLADTTASMFSVLDAVKSGANAILTSLPAGLDVAFGVGNYKDYPANDPPFQHQLDPDTNPANVTAAVNAWTASGGGDLPEGQLFALYRLAEAPGGPIGWRPDAKRIIVWFGDAPGHDPICAGLTGLGFDITEASVRARLAAEQISVLAISTVTGVANALDDDPTIGGDYTPPCANGGSAGQATRIAGDTGGTHVSGIDANEIVDTIIALIEAAVAKIGEVRLEPTASVAPFVESIMPPSYGPLMGDEEHVLPFKVRWRGVKPCGEKDVVVGGHLNAIADGSIIARKPVRITIPACPPEYVYAVKYVCGSQDDCGCPDAPVRPGRYATDINIHNPSERKAKLRKRVVPTVTAGIGVAREPRVQGPAGGEVIKLPSHGATMDDCKRLAELHYGAPAEGRLPLTIGFLEIVSTEQLVVTAVYTATAVEGGLSIDVETVQPIVRPSRPRPSFTPIPPVIGT